MKTLLYIAFTFISFISYSQTNLIQEKYNASERVYMSHLVYEHMLNCIEKKFYDLSYEVRKNKIWLNEHFGLSKKNAGLFIEEMEISSLSEYETEIDFQEECESLDKQTAINLLKNFEKTVSDKLIEENALAFEYKDNPFLEFANGYTQTFSTKGHPRAKKSDWKIKIPKSWKATEPRNENVIQRFQNDFGLGESMITLIVEDIPDEFGKGLDLEKEFRNSAVDFLKKGLGASKVTIISFKLMNIAFLKGFLAVLDIEIEQLGFNAKIRQYSYQFFDNDYMYSFHGIIDITDSFDKVDDFDSLFFMCVNSIVVNKKEYDVIYLNGNSYAKTIDIEIGRKKYDFLLDTGATITSINQNIFDELYQKGILKTDDFIRKDYVELANGQKILVELWTIPELKIGNKTVTNVVVGVQKNNTTQPLLGMNILNKLDIWKIDLDNNKIYLR
ncbi:MAG: retropepsin-like aspartic protease [Flavobacteriaceae bacterium]